MQQYTLLVFIIIATITKVSVLRPAIIMLISKTEQQNRGLPELVQFGTHLFGSCHLFERTESKKEKEKNKLQCQSINVNSP